MKVISATGAPYFALDIINLNDMLSKNHQTFDNLLNQEVS